MGYTNSPLVSFTQLSPNHSGQRNHSIDYITPHCYVGQVTVERMGKGWAKEGSVSANYGIDLNAKVGLYVEEKNRAWTSGGKDKNGNPIRVNGISGADNDHRAVTIECASDSKHPYGFKGNVYNKLVDLCEDICRRNGKTKLLWISDKNEALSYKLKSDEMLITVHRWFAPKACPGDWLHSRLSGLAAEVTKRLGGSVEVKEETKEPVKNDGTMYHVQVGAFGDKANAEALIEKLKVAGFDATIEVRENIPAKQEPVVNSLQVGDAVKLQKNAPTYGKTAVFQSWVYNSILYVREIKDSRVVISTRKTGAVTGAVDKKYLTKI